MTGIERLRDWSGTMRLVGRAWAEDMADALESIADQIEREMQPKRDPAADVSMSDYDLLPKEERDAIAWVREHGGLERVNRERENLYGVLRETCDRLDVSYFGVWTTDAQSIWRKFDWYKARLGESVPRSYAKRRIAARQRQIDESHAAIRRRNARIAELESERDELRTRVENQRSSLDGLTAAIDEMRPRLMPEGMCWPVYEDGEPVKFGDVVSDGDETGRVYYVTFDVVNPVIIGFTDETPDQDPGTWLEVSVNDGERVKRPAPKVLDADGVEIRVGDTVWTVESLRQGTVKQIIRAHDGKWRDTACVDVVFDGHKHGNYVMPDLLTHRAPVLAADGRPLREGETVWYRDHIDPLEVRGISTTESGAQYVKAYNDYEGEVSAPAEDFTHERSVVDTWERLEEDAGKNPFDYCKDVGHRLDTCENSEAYKARDIVRRAKALAERDR